MYSWFPKWGLRGPVGILGRRKGGMEGRGGRGVVIVEGERGWVGVCVVARVDGGGEGEVGGGLE